MASYTPLESEYITIDDVAYTKVTATIIYGDSDEYEEKQTYCWEGELTKSDVVTKLEELVKEYSTKVDTAKTDTTKNDVGLDVDVTVDVAIS